MNDIMGKVTAMLETIKLAKKYKEKLSSIAVENPTRLHI